MNDYSVSLRGEFILQKSIPHNKPTLNNEEIKAVVSTLSNLELTLGTKVESFEKDFTKYIGINSVATSSGTSALHLALNAIGISKNDEVILPSYTCIAVALPILYQQAKPILADIKDDYNISVEDIKGKITDRTKAVIVPHMFGYPADINEIKKLCEENSIYLVEDCAQSIGALYHDKKVGTIGGISVFSFYATKMITTIKGGMVCTDNSDWIQTIIDLRYHDQCRLFEDNDPRIKYSYMMSDVEAAIGSVQLKKLDDFIKRRRIIAELYRNGLSDDVIHPVETDSKKHVYSRYVVRTPHAPSKIIDELREHNIICERMHMPPLQKRILLKKYNENTKFEKTDEIMNSAISLPIYPSLSNEEVERVIDVFNKVLRSK